MGTVVGGEDESNKTTCEIEELAGDAEVDRNGQDDQGDRDIGAGDGPVEEKEERSAIFETRLDLAKKVQRRRQRTLQRRAFGRRIEGVCKRSVPVRV
mmetsp:Transcript_8927/g.14141  ORF Transcript_8927/g.14141 Transcript_8927/m.14141 type:complete len:97 (+) Transcript_8927:832-1122(+)